MRNLLENFLLNKIFNSISSIFIYSALNGVVWLCKLTHIDIISNNHNVNAVLGIFECDNNHIIIDIVLNDCSDFNTISKIIEKLIKYRKLFKCC